MKKDLLLILALLLVGSAYSQDAPQKPLQGKSDKGKGDIIKKGWNFGPLPVVSYDADLGFQYGATCDIFYYGDGSRYPRYDFKMNVEASRHTGGSSVLRFYGDFPYLVKNTKLFLDVSYFKAKKFEFFGYNGYESPLDFVWADSAHNPHVLDRSQFRFLASMQRPLLGLKHLYWTAGLAYYHTQAAPVSIEGYENAPSLYHVYCDTAVGLIRADEATGGNTTQFRLGLTYDSRDHNTIPSKGIYAEGTLTGTPDLIDRKGYGNLTFTMLWRQYVPLYGDKLVFAYRLGTQNLLAGEMPWYMVNNLNMLFFHKMYTEGLGGSNTVRGINRNRVMGAGFSFANIELRWKVVAFQFVNQNWIIGLNPFFDAGMVTQKYREEAMLKAPESLAVYSREKEGVHTGTGCGLKIIMNTNFVLGIDFAKALDKRDGDELKIYIGFNYIF